MSAARTGSRPAVVRWALAFVVSFGFALCAASASAANLPPEGIFENCRLDTQMLTCVQRLELMHQGGMQIVVISASSEAPASLAAYAATAHSLGMSVMWELSDPNWWQDPSTSTSMDGNYSGFVSACGCTQNGALLAYLVHWLGELPGTYGYYAADDTMLSPGDQTGVAAYVAEIKQQDPYHTVMIGSADEGQTATYQSIADVIGTEMYPITTYRMMPVSANQSNWDAYGQWAKDAQRSADRTGKQSAFILQAFTWGDNLSDGQAIGVCSTGDTQLSCYSKLRYPTAADQLELRNEILLHSHPKLILWWSFPGTYGDVTGDSYSLYPSGAEAWARWSGLAAAVQSPFPQSKRSRAHSLRARVAAAGASRKRHRKHRRHRRHHHLHHLRRHQRRRA